MRRSRLVRGLALPPTLALACLAAECGGTTALDCDPATMLPLTLGGTVNESLDTQHCISGDDPGDLYQFTLAQPTTLKVTVTSDKFTPEFSIAKLPASATSQVMSLGGSPARAFVFLPAGQYALDVQSGNNSVGAYTLATELTAPTGCPPSAGTFVFAATGMTISGRFAPTNCIDNGAAIRDPYEVRLVAGRAYSFTLRAALPRMFLDVGNGSAMVASSGFATNGTATVTYTPPTSGNYVIGVSPTNRVTTAPYTLEISP